MDDYSSSIDQHLWKVYQNSVYRVHQPQLELQIGVENEDLTVFCFDNNVHSWAYITAHNPKSQVLSPSQNQSRHDQLVEIVENKHWRYCTGAGAGDDPNWIPETSLFILDISKKEAIALAQRFDQNAIVFGTFNKAPELIWVG